ncbi:MAG: hypothetical protein Q8Q46_01310 [Candidatus Giovannonibacteria bacterium]|nr:hypothetical protein [Candidatus Giovannonibacteria bacterium]
MGKEGELFPVIEKKPHGIEKLRELEKELEAKKKIREQKERQKRIDEILKKDKK